MVGGGPAGTASAVLLAKAGWKTLLVDRARFPRDKPCGEFLTPGAAQILQSLGVWEKLTEQGLCRVDRVRVGSAGRFRLEHAPERSPAAGYTIRRRKLDAILLNQARTVGVEVREQVTFRSLIREDGQVRGIVATGERAAHNAWRSRLVIGADGSRSKVARQMGVVKPIPRLQRLAIVTHWQGLELDAGLEMRTSGSLVCGAARLPDQTVNVTLVVPMRESHRIAGRASDYVTDQIARHFPDLAEKLPASRCETMLQTTHCFGHYCRRTSDNGVMLAGDAATFVDPFTGEGVYFALRGAELAAQAANQALAAGDCSSSNLFLYDRSRRELMLRYLLCGLVQGIVRTPALFHLMIRRLRRHPSLQERLFQVLSDIELPSRILHPAPILRLLLPI